MGFISPETQESIFLEGVRDICRKHGYDPMYCLKVDPTTNQIEFLFISPEDELKIAMEIDELYGGYAV